MVTNVTSLTGNGLKDWLIQRLTAVYFAGFCFFILGFLLLHPHLRYFDWQNLFHQGSVKIATILAFFAFLLHTWVGIWTVLTDYVKPAMVRILVELLVALLLLSEFVWGIMIVWGQ